MLIDWLNHILTALSIKYMILLDKSVETEKRTYISLNNKYKIYVNI